MILVTIIDGRTQTLKIPAKGNKSVLVDLREYPQEDDHATLYRRATYYRNLCNQRKGVARWH